MKIGITASDSLKDNARCLAKSHGFEFAQTIKPNIRYWLRQSENDISLLDTSVKNLSCKIDFLSPQNLYRLKHLKQQKSYLFKAVGKPESGTRLVDATAGLAQDAFLLAAYGYEVTMLEQDPVVLVLLDDALTRLFDNREYGAYFKRKLSLTPASSEHRIPDLEFTPDIIYLDPMFPASKKTALPDKGMQLLRNIIINKNNKLLEISIRNVRNKVVVKRPLKSEFLEQITPSYQIKGKTIRYDVYMADNFN